MPEVFSHPPLPTAPEERARLKRWLNAIAIVALLDAVLLAVLLWASFSNNETGVHVLGPIHGFGFVALVWMCMDGAMQKRWGWWFPLIVVFTGGPVGSLVGDWILRRRLAEDEPPAQASTALRG